MANVLSPLAKQKFFTNNGVPADSYRLFSYEAGTSTKLVTYQDDTTGSPNSNPITLDFRGECSLWIPPNVAYKFVFAPPGSDDPPTAPIWTVDDIVSDQLVTLYGGVDTGIANAYVLTFVANFTAYTDGIVIYWIPSNTNTGASTINVNGLGPVAIVNPDGSPLYLGELVANQFSAIIYSGGSFKLFAFGFLPNIDTQNSNYTLALSNAEGIVQSDDIGTYVYTVPTDASVPFPIGTSVMVSANKLGGSLTIAADVGVTINSGPGSHQLELGTRGFQQLIKTGINQWKALLAPSAAYTSTFTGSLSGMTGATSGSIEYSITNSGLVTLYSENALTGTSNSTSMQLTTLPTEIRPKSLTYTSLIQVIDNGIPIIGVALVTTSGAIGFNVGTSLSGTGFTAAGTKGLQAGWQLSYEI